MLDFIAGVDVGASTTKVVIIDTKSNLVAFSAERSGSNYLKTANVVFEKALSIRGLERKAIKRIFSCGYGRECVDFAHGIRTEITCHALGAYFYFPYAMTLIDIGGQDNKIIRLDDKGNRVSFKMNRKCASGTGSFLEEMALRLNLDLSCMDQMACEAASEVNLGGFCTVFTATEILNKIKDGASINSLVKGIFGSIIKRVCEMDIFEDIVVFSGGVVAYNPYLVEMMSMHLKRKILIPPNPQFIGAQGAALLALRDFCK